MAGTGWIKERKMPQLLRQFPVKFTAIALSISLNACTMNSTPTVAEPAPPPSAGLTSEPGYAGPPEMAGNTTVPPAAQPSEPVMTCDQTKASWAVGKVADDALLAKVLSDTGAKYTRVLRPGVMITMEYDGTRVNVRVDGSKKVLSVVCG